MHFTFVCIQPVAFCAIFESLDFVKKCEFISWLWRHNLIIKTVSFRV